MTHRMLRLHEVIRRTGMSRSSIYKAMSENRFPAQISLGARSVAWLEDEIDEWLQQRIDESRGPSRCGSES